MKMPLTNMAENIPRNVTSVFDFSLYNIRFISVYVAMVNTYIQQYFLKTESLLKAFYCFRFFVVVFFMCVSC